VSNALNRGRTSPGVDPRAFSVAEFSSSQQQQPSAQTDVSLLRSRVSTTSPISKLIEGMNQPERKPYSYRPRKASPDPLPESLRLPEFRMPPMQSVLQTPVRKHHWGTVTGASRISSAPASHGFSTRSSSVGYSPVSANSISPRYSNSFNSHSLRRASDYSASPSSVLSETYNPIARPFVAQTPLASTAAMLSPRSASERAIGTAQVCKISEIQFCS